MSKKLFVVAPAIKRGPFGKTSTHHWKKLVEEKFKHDDRLKDTLADAEWFYWDHKVNIFSMRRADSLARELHAIVDAKNAENEYEEIVLIGHSLGGVLARAAYLISVSNRYGGSATSAWGNKVSRIILFASVNKGVKPQNIPLRIIARPLTVLLGLIKPLTATELYLGAPFITNLRIGWIIHFRSGIHKSPIVIQLLGTRDGIVEKDDSLDIMQFGNTDHIEVPGATHGDLYRTDHLKDEDAKKLRYSILIRALLDTPATEPKTSRVTKDHRHIVFILPGIRDANSTWTTDLAAVIQQRASTEVTAEVANYGYFSAGRFLLPWVRRGNVRIFQDQFSECIARNPNASFSCIGHSNGTYILGRSLKLLPEMKFERVYLAGSVLPQDYDWQGRVVAGQVKEIRNDMAASDWPVAFLCNALNKTLMMRDVGLGGFDGFNGARNNNSIQQNSYYNGGHGEAIKNANHPNIADYIISGKSAVKLGGKVKSSFRVFSQASPWLAGLLVTAFIAFLFIAIASLLGFQFLFQDANAWWIILAIEAGVLLIIYAALDWV